MDTKERIQNCAEELFYSRGYDATGVQEIAEKSGITKPTLYHYFGSKRGLLEEIFRVRYAAFSEFMEPGLDSNEGIRGKLHRIAMDSWRFYCREYRFYILFMSLSYSPKENEAYQVARPYLQKMHHRMAQVFEEASAELGNMNGRQEQFATSFTGIIGQYLLEYGSAAMDHEQQIHMLVDQYMHGIFS